MIIERGKFALHIALFSALALILVLVSSGSVSAAPVITSWSNTKTGDSDTIFSVTEGETITFSITTDKQYDHIWKVVMGGKELANHTANSTTASSFTWTVPSEKANWDIEVEVFGRRPAAAGPPERIPLRWTITTSNLKTVNPGESIQDAIDSLPAEGGVVELKEGTFNISSTIKIKRSNITLRGAGRDKTTIKAVENIGLIEVFAGDNLEATVIEWLNRGGTAPDGGPFTDEYCTISNVRIEDLHLQGYAKQFISMYAGCIASGFTKDCAYLDIWAENSSMGIVPHFSYRMLIKNNLVEHHKEPWDAYKVNYATITGNTFRDSGANNFKMNSGCGHNKIVNNIFGPSANNGLYIYGASNSNEIINNVIQSNSLSGLDIFYSYKNIIKGNVIKNNGVHGIRIASGSGSSRYIDNTITGNIIYGNKKTGIYVNEETGIIGGKVNITGNTIYGNDEHGINAVRGDFVIKNNIITNNKKYGITYGGIDIILSYNNLWNNTIGNYNGVSVGYEDISTNPLFVDPTNGDFHLKSSAGRWNGTGWVNDNETSPCIDAGDPSEKDPDGTRINMGAYGGTWEASKSISAATGTLTGIVTDKDTGLPIQGALIKASSHQTTTNSTGDYILSLPVGNYTVTASKTGYQSATSSATVNERATTTVNFTLTPIPADTTPPSAVIDLSTSNPTSHSITLTWTAPGDDGNNGTASEYDIRYSTSEITEENWNSATQCTGEPAPKPAGSSETFTVTGLSPNTTYYFALKTADEVP
ncbi:MAG: hypothetical protein DRP27_07600, partial [Thermotogae bacterium]